MTLGCAPAPSNSPATDQPTSFPASITPVTPRPSRAAAAAWTATGSTADARVGGTLTLLEDGRVLAAGGFADGDGNAPRASAELYDPATGTWARTGDMLQARGGQTATLLADGKVLVVGGGTGPTGALNTSELYDPATGRWTAAATMRFPRTDHTATRLLDGRVVVAGGSHGYRTAAMDSSVVYDPATNRWQEAGHLRTARGGGAAVRLSSGQVLLVGGANGTSPLASAELFDPVIGAWSRTGSMSEPRVAHAIALLTDGQALVAGGLRGGMVDLTPGDILATAERFDPSTETWTTAGTMADPRFQFTLTTLPNGDVLAVSGDHIGDGPVRGSDLYDPLADAWTPAGSLVAGRAAAMAVVLADGRLLVAGGEGPGARGLATAELFGSRAAAP